MALPRRRTGDERPPNAEDVTVCPSCGEDRLGDHCPNRSIPCGWLLCGNRECRSYGIPGWRWVDMRKRPAA